MPLRLMNLIGMRMHAIGQQPQKRCGGGAPPMRKCAPTDGLLMQNWSRARGFCTGERDQTDAGAHKRLQVLIQRLVEHKKECSGRLHETARPAAPPSRRARRRQGRLRRHRSLRSAARYSAILDRGCAWRTRKIVGGTKKRSLSEQRNRARKPIIDFAELNRHYSMLEATGAPRAATGAAD